MTKHATSYSLSAECLHLIKQLARRLGIAQSAIIELAIRALARKER